MMALARALDAVSPTGIEDLGGRWDRSVLEGLVALDAGGGGWDEVAGVLTTERAWVLLSWAEGVCSWAVRSESLDLVRRVLQALALVDRRLDRRDVLIVASLARRAVSRMGSSFDELVGSVIVFGEPLPGWFASAHGGLPKSHREVGEGLSFAFVRERVEIDPSALRDLFGEC